MTTTKHPRLAWNVLKLMAMGLLAAAFVTGVSADSTTSAPPPPAAQRSAPNWFGQGALPTTATQVEKGDGAAAAPASLPGIVRVIDSGDGCRVILAAEAAEHEQYGNGTAVIIECRNVAPEAARLGLPSSPDDVPPAPILLSPADNATLDTLLPRFFVDTTVSNVQISPRIQVSRDPGFGQLSAGVTFCGWTRPQSQFDYLTSENLLPNTRYYWRARSAYGDACSNPNLSWGDWSPTWSFVTGSNGAILPAPQLASPANGSVVPLVRPTLSWQSVPGAVGTEIVGRPLPPVINPGDFGWGITWEIGVTTSAQVYRDLTAGQTYEWYVRFRNEYAWGNQSERWRFMVGNSSACADTTEIPRSECEALASLFTSTNGANWLNKNGWLVTNTPCSWHGVTCAGGHVTRLELWRNRLDGTIPSELSSLDHLLFLQLGGNNPQYGGNLRGVIPAELGSLASLQILYLHDNELTGSIPSALENLARLEGLVLSNNYLDGSIPPELGQLQSLAVLDLGSNELSGEIPRSFGNLANIRYMLSLYNNNLSGPIPAELGQLTQLEALILDNNQLTGGLPAELGDMAAMRSLSVSRNLLTGSPPSELGNLGNLRRLRIDHNPLDGALPYEWMRLALTTFAFQETGLCEPSNTAFQNWLTSIANLQRTGNICATLEVNFPAGAPGSYFLLTGSGYPPNADATVTANGNVVGTVATDTGGEFSFRLETPDADPGFYLVTASVNPAASTYLRLSLDQPIRPLEGSGPILNVPAGIAFDRAVYLPVVWN